MAFIKRCIANIHNCDKCGKVAVSLVGDKWYCEDCVKIMESKEQEEKTKHLN